MKIKLDIDYTPQEARQFLGLPDVAPMQDALMEEVQGRLQANLSTMDPETLVKTWMLLGLQGLEQLQRMMWSQMGMAPDSDGDKDR